MGYKPIDLGGFKCIDPKNPQQPNHQTPNYLNLFYSSLSSIRSLTYSIIVTFRDRHTPRHTIIYVPFYTYRINQAKRSG